MLTLILQIKIGQRCETRFNPCFSAAGEPVCKNNGFCQVNLGVPPFYQCQCRFGFSGPNCETVATTTKFTTLSPTLGACIDRNPNVCPYYAANNYCSNLYYINQMPIPTYCAKSCNTCSANTNAPVTRPCTDSQFVCVYWASSGNCGRLPNPNLCRKSCGLC